jgi:hypothetical protein
MQCFPIYSVLMALGNPTVDLFSLDIEGAEIQVKMTKLEGPSLANICGQGQEPTIRVEFSKSCSIRLGRKWQKKTSLTQSGF